MCLLNMTELSLVDLSRCPAATKGRGVSNTMLLNCRKDFSEKLGENRSREPRGLEDGVEPGAHAPVVDHLRDNT